MHALLVFSGFWLRLSLFFLFPSSQELKINNDSEESLQEKHSRSFSRHYVCFVYFANRKCAHPSCLQIRWCSLNRDFHFPSIIHLQLCDLENFQAPSCSAEDYSLPQETVRCEHRKVKTFLEAMLRGRESLNLLRKIKQARVNLYKL